MMSPWGQHLNGAAASGSGVAAPSLPASDPQVPAAEGSPAAAIAATGSAPGVLVAVRRQQTTGKCPQATGNAAAAAAEQRLRSPTGRRQRRRLATGLPKQRLWGLPAGGLTLEHLPLMPVQSQVAADRQHRLTMARQQQQPMASLRERLRRSRGARPVLPVQPPTSMVS